MITTTSASNNSGASGGSNFGAACKSGALSVASSTYFAVTVTPSSGYKIALTSITFGQRCTGTGPQAITVYSSIDNYAAPIGTATEAANSTWTLKSITFSGASLVGAANTAVTLRIYGSGVSGSPSANTATWRIDDVNLVVTATAVASAPTLTTSIATSIGTTTATLGATVAANGGDTITERGTVWGTTAAPTGNALAEGDTAVSAFSHSRSGFSPNVQYTYRGYAINSAGTGYSPDGTFWTLANTPSAPTVNGATTSSLDVTVNASGNPASTTFAIHETGGNYVQSVDGSLAASPDWQTAATWGTKTVTGLNPNTAYTFEVKARNGANVETGYGATASDTTLALGCTPPTIDSTTPVNLTCNGSADGSITVSASGGLTPYEYSKDNGATWQSGNAFTGLAAGNYQIKVRGVDECASPSTLVTLTQPAAVTITLGSNPTVCFGTTTANLTYSATTGTPTLYSIDFDAAAEGQGFIDVTDASLPASPIVIAVPGTAAAGTYNATLTVKTNTCTSASYAITVTVNAASVGGSIAPATTAFCASGSTTLTLSGHTGSVTKWQFSTVSDFSSGVTDVANTTTTLTTPTLTATRYYRAVVTNGVCSAANSAIATLTVNPLPTITLGTNPVVCSDASSANKFYTATTGSPDQYSIDFNVAANTAGFADVVLASLPASPIVIPVPYGVAAGTYTGTLTVKNSTTGCESAGTAISVTVNAFTLPTTIAAQGFETSGDTWSYTSSGSGGTASSATGSSDTPASQRILAGSRSWQVNNSGATTPSILTFDSVSVSGYSSVSVTVRASSTSLSTGNGVEPEDHVKVFVALNGGAFSATPDIDLFGADNARWGYTATLIRTTPVGTPVTAQSPQNGTSDNNYSTLRVTIPNGTASVRLKLEVNNDAGNEVWNVDGITLTGTPPAVASITPSGATTFCGSGTVTLTANAGGASYLWSPGGATTAAITVSPSSTTTYTVVVTGANGCSSSASQTVTVNQPATVSAGPDQMIPSGNTVTLAGTIGGGAGSATWSGGTGSFSPNATTLNAVYTPSGAEVAARTVTLTLTTDAPGTCPAVNDSFAITINSPPVATTVAFNCTPGLSAVIQITGSGGIVTDADGDALTLTTAGYSAAGTNLVFTVGGDKYIYYQNTNANALTDSFTYTVSDGFGGTDTKTITINITGPNSQSQNKLSGPDLIGAGPEVRLQFLTIPDYSYALEWTHSLSEPITWLPLVTNTASTNGLIIYTNTPSVGPDFYRTRWVP